VPGPAWGLPILGLLPAIAVLPALAPRFWARRTGLVSLTWSLALLLPRAAAAGAGGSASEAWHALLIQYPPLATLLLALYNPVGGMHAQGRPAGTPAGNTRTAGDGRRSDRQHHRGGGRLSAFLYNSSTYLVFFNFTSIQPDAPAGGQALALQAISAGAMCFGG